MGGVLKLRAARIKGGDAALGRKIAFHADNPTVGAILAPNDRAAKPRCRTPLLAATTA
jgi:hypothetical protein